MQKIRAWGASAAGKPLAPMTIERREPGPRDVVLVILFCGVCHSDIHQARDEWSGGLFPMVPGHEIIGRVARLGRDVSKFKVGDLAGVGCLVDSCRACAPCTGGLEQFCEKGPVLTYNGYEYDGKTPTEHSASNLGSSLGAKRSRTVMCDRSLRGKNDNTSSAPRDRPTVPKR